MKITTFVKKYTLDLALTIQSDTDDKSCPQSTKVIHYNILTEMNNKELGDRIFMSEHASCFGASSNFGRRSYMMQQL